MAQPRTSTTIGVVDRGPDEESTANESMSSEAVNEDRSSEAVNEDKSAEAVNDDRSAEAVNDERSAKMADKPRVGGEVAKPKTTEVPEPTPAETMTTKAHPRNGSGMGYIDARNGSRARCTIRECQGGEC